jgi:hypothetical protein
MTIDLVSAGGWVFSVLTAYIAYKGATLKHAKTTRDGDKNVYVTAVTNERAKWREELRRSVSEFAKASIEPIPSAPELLRLKTDIILRLNPRAREPAMAAKHAFDLKIMNAVNTIYAAATSGQTADVQKTLGDLELNAQELLKQEWQKSKEEAIAGRGRPLPSEKSDA